MSPASRDEQGSRAGASAYELAMLLCQVVTTILTAAGVYLTAWAFTHPKHISKTTLWPLIAFGVLWAALAILWIATLVRHNRFVKLLRRLGISKIHAHTLEPMEEVSARIANGRDIGFLLTSGRTFLSNYHKSLASALQRGARVMVIIGDPDENYIKEYQSAMFNRIESDYAGDVSSAANDLKNLYIQVGNHMSREDLIRLSPRVEVRRCAYVNTCSLLRVDETFLQYAPMLPPIRPAHGHSLTLDPAGLIADQCYQHWQRMYNVSIPWISCCIENGTVKITDSREIHPIQS